MFNKLTTITEKIFKRHIYSCQGFYKGIIGLYFLVSIVKGPFTAPVSLGCWVWCGVVCASNARARNTQLPGGFPLAPYKTRYPRNEERWWGEGWKRKESRIRKGWEKGETRIGGGWKKEERNERVESFPTPRPILPPLLPVAQTNGPFRPAGSPHLPLIQEGVTPQTWPNMLSLPWSKLYTKTNVW